MLFWPSMNAFFNLVSTVLLTFGYIAIKDKHKSRHKKLMISAVISSTLFLVGYLIYHYQVGSVPYPHYNWTRPVYFTILIPHVILAAVMVPFILYILWQALHDRFDRHARVARFVWPVWMFVSVSGVTIYLMLYHL